MTSLPITQLGDAPEPGDLATPPTSGPRRRRPLVVAAALLLPLIAFAALVIFVFQPFANAAGGCGGG